MALVACRECKAKVSTSANACPACGASPPAKKSDPLLKFLAGVGLVVVIGLMVANSNGGSSPPPPQVASQAPPSRSPAQIQADKEVNTVLKGAQLLKDSMKKPETFELLSAILVNGDTICYEYRARNSFNDRTTEHYVVSNSVSSGSPKEWNRLCANRAGTDYTHVRAVLR